MGNLIDLTGMTFGRLRVLKRADDYISPKGNRSVKWLCECNCNDKTIITALGANLKAGNTKSCGCLNREIVSNNSKIKNKKKNQYDLSGEYGIGRDSKNREFYFDIDDYDKIKNYYWFTDNNSGYISSFIDGNKIMMHRLITNCPDNMNVDHKHGNATRNDNRKSNLRICTIQENRMNAGLQSNNTSGCTGVVWNKRVSKWMANIKYNNKRIHLGYFVNFDDAVKARKEAEEKYFGEFSYDNSRNT